MDQPNHGMGRAGATAYVLSSIIGSGIFIMPTSVVNNVHSMGASLIIWASAGIVAALGAFCYMELGTRIRRSGGDFAYLCHIGWRPIAFSHAICSTLIIHPGSIAIQTGTFAEYMVKGLRLEFCDQATLTRVHKLISINLIFLFFLLNCFSIRQVVVPFQILALLSKVLACGTIIAVGLLVWIIRGANPDNFRAPFANSNLDPGNVVLALFAALLAYSGCEILNVGMEDIRKPRRTLPFAFIVGLSVVGVFYLTMNLAYFVVLSVPELQKSNAIAMTFAEHSFAGFLLYAMPFLICIQLVGTLNAVFFGHSRFMWSISRESLFPSFVSCINRQNGSPRAALFLHMVLAVVMTSFGNVQQLISSVMFTDSIMKCMAMLVLLRLKLCRTRPLPHPGSVLHVPLLFPLLYLAICLSLATITIFRNFWISLLGLLAISVGLLCYGLFIWEQGFRRFVLYRHILRALNHFTSALAQVIFDGNIDLAIKHNKEEPRRKKNGETDKNPARIHPA